VQRMERGGFLIWGTLLPPPQEATEPLACQRAPGGLRRVPLVALLLGIHPRPAGMPERCGGPRDERVPEDLGPLEAPVSPGLLAPACGAGGAPGILLPCGGGGRAFPLFATGDEQPGGEDGPRSWERLAQGAIRLALRAGRSQGLHGCQGDPALVDKGWDAQGLGRDTARLRGQGEGRLEGVAALGDDVRRASTVVAADGCQRGAPGALGGFAGGQRRTPSQPMGGAVSGNH